MRTGRPTAAVLTPRRHEGGILPAKGGRGQGDKKAHGSLPVGLFVNLSRCSHQRGFWRLLNSPATGAALNSWALGQCGARWQA